MLRLGAFDRKGPAPGATGLPKSRRLVARRLRAIQLPDSLDKSNALRYIGEVNPEIKAAAWVRDLASRGTYHFTTAEAETALGVSGVAARASLRRLKAKQLIASPFRGFQVILPPEYRHIGCLPAEDFVPQLLGRLGVPYYFGLLSAAAFYGAAHQQPQVAQVVVPKNRPAIECGRVKVEFIARGNLVEIPLALSTPLGAGCWSRAPRLLRST